MPQVIKCARVSLPKAGHPQFISPSKKLAIGRFHWTENGGTGRYQVSTGRSTPCVRCTGVGHVSFLDFACQFLTATCNTPDALQVHTGRSGAHRTRAQRGLQKPPTPDAYHRTLSKCVRCLTLAGSSTPDAEASVRCLRTQRPVSVSQRENTPATSPNFPPAQ